MKKNKTIIVMTCLWVSVPWIWGWQFPPSPVGFTEAKQVMLRQEIRLTGTVRGRVGGSVAGEVAGLVVEIMVEEGSKVTKGQPLLRLDTDRTQLQIKAAQGNLQDTVARLKLAENRLKRAESLFEQEIYSTQQLEDNRFEVQAMAGSRLRLEALLEELRLNLKRAVVHAPYEGTILKKSTEVGQWVTAGGDVFEMISLAEPVVWVAVPERYYASLRVGDRVKVTFDALPNQLEGEIIAVIPRASESRTIPVKIAIPNEDGRIPEGILARVSFLAGDAYKATMVPKDAVLSQSSGKQVYLLGEDEKVAAVTVETGIGSGLWIEVIGSIQPGQKVITLGNERVQPGQVVKGQLREYQEP